jgi:16S rRNA (guanine527-N7)-methyltransferase
MLPARIAELLEPFLGPANDERLTTGDLHNISTYIDILLRWNAHINLTAIRDPEEIVTRHFGESFFAASRLFPSNPRVVTGDSPVHAESFSHSRQTTPIVEAAAHDQRPATNDHPTVADLGSGAGFPGLPIKIWAPHISLTLVESNHKKATFLREVARALTLTDVNIQNVRAEDLHERSFDLVTLRAVERFDTILPIAANLVAPGGRLALLISSAQLDQAQASLPHLVWTKPDPIPSSRSRILAVAHRPT